MEMIRLNAQKYRYLSTCLYSSVNDRKHLHAQMGRVELETFNHATLKSNTENGI
ncbi:hypothetical protein [Acinetobacter sp. ANC 4648]|uniref:hypothetical protein n=1 Tax=Acinetobacter sp. ANC 4648 TaxID=1977875 RepID=UPI00148A5E57|nr:hypothetical protein [Acinetobacter sp. ANC 4648]